MNLGGEPERDDSGLPPVDIKIPDDARELDRDVQAYHRELRALRRRQRAARLHAPLTRDGVILPLLASGLVLVLIAGTLLTVFTAGPSGDALPRSVGAATTRAATGGSIPNGTTAGSAPGPAGAKASASASATAPATPADSPTAALTSKHLPDKAVRIDGSPVRLASLTTAVLVLVPAACDCAALISRLATQAAAARVNLYVVGGSGLMDFQQLPASLPQSAQLADDRSGALAQTFPPAGLTALLVRPDGEVAVARPLQQHFILTSQLSQLAAATTASPGASAAASATTTTSSSPPAPSPSASVTAGSPQASASPSR